MMLDESLLRTTMRARLALAGGLPSEDLIAWENRTFETPSFDAADPIEPVVWVREWQRIILERKSAIGMIEASGETIYAVYTPKGQGTASADALVKSIAEQFEAGQALTEDGIVVILERTSRSDYRQAPDHETWMFKSVTVQWRVFTRSST